MKRFDVMCSGKQMMSSATSQEKQVVAKIMELLKEWEFIYYLLHLSGKTHSYHILRWSCRHTGRNPYAKPHPLQRSNTDVGTATKPMTSASRADGNAPFTYIRLLSPETRSTRWQQQTWHHLPTYKNDNPIYNKSAVYRDAYPAPYRHWNIHPDWELKQNSWRTVRATVSIRASYCSELVFRLHVPRINTSNLFIIFFVAVGLVRVCLLTCKCYNFWTPLGTNMLHTVYCTHMNAQPESISHELKNGFHPVLTHQYSFIMQNSGLFVFKSPHHSYF